MPATEVTRCGVPFFLGKRERVARLVESNQTGLNPESAEQEEGSEKCE